MLTRPQLVAALDRAGIGHTIVPSLRHPDRWVTAGAVSVEDFARVVEAAARAQALSEAYDLLFDVAGSKATRFDAQRAIRLLADPSDVQAWVALARAAKSEDRTLISENRTSNTARAWLAEQPKEAEHAPPA